MGIDGRNTYTYTDLSGFEQWGLDKLGLQPHELWDRVFNIVGWSVFGIAIVVAGTVILVKCLKLRAKTKVDGRIEPKQKKRKTVKVCLVKVQMTETTADECCIESIPKGEQIPIPEREGYRFLGWFYDRECKKPFMPVDEITDNLILYARWAKEGD